MRGIFFYDGDCGFCQWSAEKLRALTEGELDVRPAWVGKSRRDLPAHVDREVQRRIAREAVYWRTENAGDVVEGGAFEFFGGHRAIALALQDHGRSSAIRVMGRVIVAPGVAFVAKHIYAIVAANRYKLVPLVGQQACAVPGAHSD